MVLIVQSMVWKYGRIVIHAKWNVYWITGSFQHTKYFLDPLFSITLRGAWLGSFSEGHIPPPYNKCINVDSSRQLVSYICPKWFYFMATSLVISQSYITMATRSTQPLCPSLSKKHVTINIQSEKLKRKDTLRILSSYWLACVLHAMNLFCIWLCNIPEWGGCEDLGCVL